MLIQQEWIGEQLRNFAQVISDTMCSSSRHDSSIVNNSEHQLNQPLTNRTTEVATNAQKEFQRLAVEFQHLADTCLLMLHLESRISCFARVNSIAAQVSSIFQFAFVIPNVNLSAS